MIRIISKVNLDFMIDSTFKGGFFYREIFDLTLVQRITMNSHSERYGTTERTCYGTTERTCYGCVFRNL